jgi:hypothetical protein
VTPIAAFAGLPIHCTGFRILHAVQDNGVFSSARGPIT